MYHLTGDAEENNSLLVLHNIRKLVHECCVECGESVCTVLPAIQRTYVDMSRGFKPIALRVGQKGV